MLYYLFCLPFLHYLKLWTWMDQFVAARRRQEQKSWCHLWEKSCLQIDRSIRRSFAKNYQNLKYKVMGFYVCAIKVFVNVESSKGLSLAWTPKLCIVLNLWHQDSPNSYKNPWFLLMAVKNLDVFTNLIDCVSYNQFLNWTIFFFQNVKSH